MLIFEHINQLARMAGFDNCLTEEQRKERRSFIAQIKPIKFGSIVEWSLAATYVLARHYVPRDTILLVARVENYVFNFSGSAVPDSGAYEPLPPGDAYWRQHPIIPNNSDYDLVTPLDGTRSIVTDCDEYLIFQGGYAVELLFVPDIASPDSVTRNISTLVYSYYITPEVVDLIGGRSAVSVNIDA